MGHRLSKIYTRTGDKGDTGLGDGRRTPKDSARIEAIGTVDELNSSIGLIMASAPPRELFDILMEVQHDLLDLGGEIAIPGFKLIEQGHVARLENTLDHYNADLPMLKEFILPSGGMATAHCHLARTICRRAERRMVTLMHDEELSPLALAYVNRLSDLLFVLARVLARHENGSEVLWQRQRGD